MIVEKFGSKDLKEIDDPPTDAGCIYCYAAAKTCRFFKAGDVHFIRVEGELKEVVCMSTRVVLVLACKSVTEEEVRALIAEHPAYN